MFLLWSARALLGKHSSYLHLPGLRVSKDHTRAPRQQHAWSSYSSLPHPGGVPSTGATLAGARGAYQHRRADCSHMWKLCSPKGHVTSFLAVSHWCTCDYVNSTDAVFSILTLMILGKGRSPMPERHFSRSDLKIYYTSFQWYSSDKAHHGRPALGKSRLRAVLMETLRTAFRA